MSSGRANPQGGHDITQDVLAKLAGLPKQGLGTLPLSMQGPLDTVPLGTAPSLIGPSRQFEAHFEDISANPLIKA